jgi:hypothetical protein
VADDDADDAEEKQGGSAAAGCVEQLRDEAEAGGVGGGMNEAGEGELPVRL